MSETRHAQEERIYCKDLDNFFFKNFEIVQGRLKRAWRHTWVKNNFERERIVLKKLLFEFRAGSKGLG